MGELRRLPESELDIMLVIWAAQAEVTAPDILAGLARPLTASALHSYLKRLEEKGFLSCRKAGKTNCYTALVTQAAYQELEGKTLLQKLYAGSLKRFTAALYDGGTLKTEDLAELRRYLETLERGTT